MNFFFGVNQGDIQSKISIPKFQNSGKFNKDNLLYSASIVNSKWFVKREKTEETESFFKLKANEIDNHKIFFIATEQEVSSYFSNNVGDKLEDLNTFSDTAPSFRCNLKLVTYVFIYNFFSHSKELLSIFFKLLFFGTQLKYFLNFFISDTEHSISFNLRLP